MSLGRRILVSLSRIVIRIRACQRTNTYFLINAFWALSVLGFVPGTSFGQATHQPEEPATLGSPVRTLFVVQEMNSPIRVDGVLDEPDWASATLVTLPYETYPADNAPAPVETHCKIMFDKNRLYFGCKAYDPNPEEIRAFLVDRDQMGTHDHVSLIIDPFNDARRAFDFAVNPLGVQLDGLINSSGRFDGAWDAIWESAGKITEDGYVVEAAIPFKSFRFPATKRIQEWGMYMERWRPRSHQTHIMSIAWDRSNTCQLCQANILRGIQEVDPGRNLEVVPTFTGSQTNTREDLQGNTVERGPIQQDVGLDVRWSITPNLSLNGTLNPDFSQVEADVAQLDVNNRFALFFPEKRPFFLEGADFFRTSIPIVFSRTIVDPRYGTKLTGKVGSSAVGVIVAQDALTNLVIPGREGSSSAFVNRENTVSVVRFRQDIGASSTIGALYTGREGEEYYNRVVGVDAILRGNSPFQVDAQFLRSDTRYPEEVVSSHDQTSGSFSGDVGRFQVSYNTRTWFGRANVWALSPTFRGDAGFITQVDARGVFWELGRNIWPGKSWVTQVIPWIGGERSESYGGLLVKNEFWYWLSYQGPMQSFVWIWPRYSKEQFAGTEYRINYSEMYVGLRPTGRINMSVFSKVGDEIDFANARKAETFRLTSSIDMRLSRRLTLDVNHTYQRLYLGRQTIFRANLMQFRTDYFFTSRMFLRLILQYQDTERNTALYKDQVDRQTNSLFSQLLYSYKLNPQSVLFLGFSNAKAGATDFLLNRQPLRQTDRTIFLKIGYAWRP